MKLVLSEKQKVIVEREVMHIFTSRADRNHDGYLEVNELSLLMEELGMYAHDARKLLKAADKNNDGRIDPGEFLTWIFSGSKNAYMAAQAALSKQEAPLPVVPGNTPEPEEDPLDGDEPSTELAEENPEASPTEIKEEEVVEGAEEEQTEKTQALEKEEHLLSDQEVRSVEQDVRHLFTFFADTNRDGFLEEHELANIMEDLGMQPSDACRLLRAADKNSDGRIDTRELLNWIFSGSKHANMAAEAAAAMAPQPELTSTLPGSPQAKARKSTMVTIHKT